MNVVEKLRYTVSKRGNLFWQPTKEMRAVGFQAQPLGLDCDASRAKAKHLAQAWDEAKGRRGQVTTFPPGTFGAFWDRWRRTEGWKTKELRTRQDYERAWAYIDAWQPVDDKGRPAGPMLSRTFCTEITTELCEQFNAHMVRTASASERWRAIKGLKILLADMVVRLRLGYASPAEKIVNPQPAGRSAIWLAGEVEEASVIALMLGFEGMSLGIRIAWETLFSPVDVWSLPFGALKRDASGAYFHRDRTKTDAEAFGAISDELAADLAAYMARQPFEYLADTPILRQRNGHAYRSKDTFGDDFRWVRLFAFGEGETRQFMDIRRSANVEADAAGADKKTMGELLANGLADSRFLDKTYTPATVTKSREVALQRVQGRRKLAVEAARLRASNAS